MKPNRAAAEASKPTAALDLGVFSQYIWRGLELSYNSVVIQPSVTLGYEGFSFNVWGNMDTDLHIRGSEDTDVQIHGNGFDPFLRKDPWAGQVDRRVYLLCAGRHARETGSQDSQELFASATLDTILSPTLSVYREIAHSPAWYINFGISHSQPIYDKITLDLAASAGYYYSDDNDFAEINDPQSRYREFHNGLVTAGLTIPFGEYFSVKPLIGYSFPLSGNADDYIKATSISDHSSFFYGGITLSMAF